MNCLCLLVGDIKLGPTGVNASVWKEVVLYDLNEMVLCPFLKSSSLDGQFCPSVDNFHPDFSLFFHSDRPTKCLEEADYLGPF